MFSSLLFLMDDAFTLRQSKTDRLLCNNLPGISLVLFYSDDCKHCEDCIPIFEQLPNNLNGCAFAIVNLDKNKKLVELSRDTLLQIEYVPLIVAYVDGKPYVRYD